jgi:hypothetical protein
MISKFIGVATQLYKSVLGDKIWCILAFHGIHGVTLHMIGERKTEK